MLKVKLLSDSAKMPTLSHPGEDLGYDLYSSASGILTSKGKLTLPTGVAAEFLFESEPALKFGFLVKERSSLANQGVVILGGIVDAGYRGEIHLILGSFADEDINIQAGDKIANLVPIPVVATSTIEIVSDLSLSIRGESWNGSTGR